jgi:hypothetical protein
VRLNLIISGHYQANEESQCESTILAGGVSRIITSKLVRLAPASQPETPDIGQRRDETILRHPQEAVCNVLSDNLTVLYHLREKLRRSSSLRKR